MMSRLLFLCLLVTLIGTPAVIPAMAGTVVPPPLAFPAPASLGHWVALSATWNDTSGPFAPLTPLPAKDGNGAHWGQGPGSYLGITSKGRMAADNGNDAILAFTSTAATGLRWRVGYENRGTPLFLSVWRGKTCLREQQLDKGAKGEWSGIAELAGNDTLYIRVALKHLHAGAAGQDLMIRPELVQVGALPDPESLPVAARWPRVDGKPFFPIGFLHYSTDDPRLAEFARLGFNATQRDIAWSQIEPEKGVFDGSIVQETLDGAQRLGFKTSLLFSWHFSPTWLPEAWRFRDADGKPAGAGWLPACLWDPEVREHQKKVIQTVVAVAAKHPATLSYCLANEPDMGGFQIGYCEHAVHAYHDWLKQRYGTVAALNRRWQTNLAGFDQVRPPKPDPATANRAAWLDWILFRNDSFAAYWEWMAGIIREQHPGAIITHKMMWKGMISDLAAPHQQNYRLWSRAVSVTGGDIYPHPYENFTLRWIMDSYRSFGDGKQVWINEHNGAGVEATNPPAPAMPPETYSAWLWQAVGRGAGGVFHWCLMPGLQADNGGWYSFSDATLSPAFWVTCRELQRLRKIEPYLFRTTPEPGEVAILHSWPSLIQQPGKPISGYATSVADALYRAHVPVRFIDEEMLRSGRLDGVKAILLPGSFCLGDAEVTALQQFAARGGLVVAWPKTGDCDELNQPARPRFQKLCGIRVAGYDAHPMPPDGVFLDIVHHSWTYQKAPIDQKLTTANYRKTPVRIIPGRHLLGSLAGTELAGGPLTGFEDLALDQEVNARIEPAGATVMARFPDGRPAVTQNGRFVYVGTTPMAAGKNWQIALRQLLETAGVTPPGYVRDAGGRPVDHVDLATLNGVGFRLIIVTNHALGRFYDGRPAAGLTIGVRGPANLRLIQLLDTPTEIVPSLKNGYGEIPAAFLPGEAKVFLAVP